MGLIVEAKEITLPMMNSLNIRPNKLTYELLINHYF